MAITTVTEKNSLFSPQPELHPLECQKSSNLTSCSAPSQYHWGFRRINWHQREKITHKAHSKVVGLCDFFCWSFNAVLMTAIWVNIVESFDERNMILQSRLEPWHLKFSLKPKLIANNAAGIPKLKQGRCKQRVWEQDDEEGNVHPEVKLNAIFSL